MAAPIVIESISHWNTTLRAAKQEKTPIFVDFFATWCGPCSAIAPAFEHLAEQFSNAVFLKVDVDKLQPIAQKYKITAMPTFYTITEEGPVDSIQGADRSALREMVEKYTTRPSTVSHPPLPDKAEGLKAEGNAAFAEGKYVQAFLCYSRALDVAPGSAVLHVNRAHTLMKMVKMEGTTKTDRNKYRRKALEDCLVAAPLDDGKWGKAWLRLAEASLLSAEEESIEEFPITKRAMKRKERIAGAEEALRAAIEHSEGQIKAEAERLLLEVRARMGGV
ncbi:thioredoxin-domain-containing protein [Lentinus tigrinus ALCF2SS1-7]|uniref:Thioredoxin-domain-containing protein n=1 Tax=Lentinus tigrinus ALCF2SS1-6 TaxID=1328759 RepID=A0A5C2RMM2_9APHY|nr:thioredoxin-domain-containing protein [Lentinus tigrinus ALCF2SS1-6]RPD71820.1 thioredoxin-domain-containing protein [Lentinus tigrinus ALCF2SS1-7]